MKIPIQHVLSIILLLLALCFEHTIGLPFFSFTGAIFLFASLPNSWRNVVFVLGSIALASIYLLPFWLSFLLFFILRTSIEALPFSHWHQDILIATSILICTAVVGVWVQYQLTMGNLILIGVSCCLFGFSMMYLVRQRLPEKKSRMTYAK